jgi:hypothetical protein
MKMTEREYAFLALLIPANEFAATNARSLPSQAKTSTKDGILAPAGGLCVLVAAT